MSLHSSVGPFQVIETLQFIDLQTSRDDHATPLAVIPNESPRANFEDRAKRLRNGSRIISFDPKSHAALCTQDGNWSVWLLDPDGEPIRGGYFKSLRAAAYDYAERVMGYHPSVGDVELNESEGFGDS